MPGITSKMVQDLLLHQLLVTFNCIGHAVHTTCKSASIIVTLYTSFIIRSVVPTQCLLKLDRRHLTCRHIS